MKQGFDERVVSYEDIHNIKQESFDLLLKTASPRPGEIILDAMCGYGAMAKLILEKEPDTEVHLSDESEVQVERARKNLPGLPENRFKVVEFPDSEYSSNLFDKAIVKMGIHENPLQAQYEVVKDFFRILKPGGLLIVWDIFLKEETQRLFQDVIRKKDELSGYDMLTRERYFFREDEFIDVVSKAGFIDIKKRGRR